MATAQPDKNGYAYSAETGLTVIIILAGIRNAADIIITTLAGALFAIVLIH